MHPILLKTPYFTIYSYGLCMAVAVMLAWVLSSRLARRAPYSSSQAADLLFVLFFSGVIGARLFYVLQHPSEYMGRWHAMFFLQEGGLVWYGGFIGAVACGMLYARWRGIPILPWADLFSPALALSQAVGRFGCWLNGCCFGRDGHAVQLYEAAALVALSLFLFARFTRRKIEGEVFAFYLIGYGLARFALEFLRGDQTAYMGLTLPQWISFCAVIFGSWLYADRRRSHR